jgi:hypothetical protein
MQYARFPASQPLDTIAQGSLPICSTRATAGPAALIAAEANLVKRRELRGGEERLEAMERRADLLIAHIETEVELAHITSSIHESVHVLLKEQITQHSALGHEPEEVEVAAKKLCAGEKRFVNTETEVVKGQKACCMWIDLLCVSGTPVDELLRTTCRPISTWLPSFCQLATFPPMKGLDS